MNKIKFIDSKIDINRYWENLSLTNIECEIWKDVFFYDMEGVLFDFTGFYKISNKGRVKSLPRIDCRNQKRHEKILKQDSNSTYLRVMISKDNIKIRVSVHRLVLFAFKGYDKEKRFGNHINAIRSDNQDNNLEWTTTSENILHAYKIGTKKLSVAFQTAAARKGVLNPGSKGVIQLDKVTGKEIAKFGCDREAAEMVGVTRKAINLCVLGKSNSSGGFKWKRI